MPLGPSKMAKKIPKGSSIFSFKNSSNKIFIAIPEFLLTKDREIADNVHQGPLSIDFDDEWIRA